jgi:hypothetical protein
MQPIAKSILRDPGRCYRLRLRAVICGILRETEEEYVWKRLRSVVASSQPIILA